MTWQGPNVGLVDALTGSPFGASAPIPVSVSGSIVVGSSVTISGALPAGANTIGNVGLVAGSSLVGTVLADATATASPPSYASGSQNVSLTLSGGLRSQLTLGATDLLLGQAAKAGSLPVTIASDQGNLGTTVASALPAGANTIGNVGLVSGTALVGSVETSDGTNIGNILPATSSSNALAAQGAQLVAGADKEVTFSVSTSGAFTAASTDALNYRSVSVHLTSLGAGGTVTFQGSNDNANWVSVSLSFLNAGNILETQWVAGGAMFAGPLNCRYFRLSFTGVSSGTTAGVVEFHTNPTVTFAPPANPGQATMANSSPVVIASNQSAVPTNVSPTAGSAFGITPVASASAEASHVLKNAAGNLYSVYAVNLTSTSGFLCIVNAASVPGTGAISPLYVVPLPASGISAQLFFDIPAVFSTGIVALLTSAASPFTFTSGTITGFITGQTA